MSKRWAAWVQKAYPLNDKDKEMMVLSCDYEYLVANPAGRKRKATVKSPAQQFDESHKKWLEGGREC